MCVNNTTLRTYTNAKSWLTWNSESGLKSRGEAAGGSHNNTCRFILANAVSDHSVRRNSGSINSVASLIVNTTTNHTSICTNMDVYKHYSMYVCTYLRSSNEIRSSGLWFQANSTAIWNVVTSRSNFPTWFWNAIWNTVKIIKYTEYSIILFQNPKGDIHIQGNTYHEIWNKWNNRKSYHSIRQYMVPVKLPALMSLPVELLNIRDEVLQFTW